MSEVKFIEGLIVKKPENAPDFVKVKLSFKVEEFKKYIEENQNAGWINVDVLESKGGKYYGKLNEWKKEGQAPPPNTPLEEGDDDLPF